ncbi:hypothetical protein VTJ04DRAFT_4399 [Mycothermus thermophilus]|uniref:uncharacterized protein n=1 Tax=Humicola insolens TaxID=85995 RepID=UPI0037421294
MTQKQPKPSISIRIYPKIPFPKISLRPLHPYTHNPDSGHDPSQMNPPDQPTFLCPNEPQNASTPRQCRAVPCRGIIAHR